MPRSEAPGKTVQIAKSSTNASYRYLGGGDGVDIVQYFAGKLVKPDEALVLRQFSNSKDGLLGLVHHRFDRCRRAVTILDDAVACHDQVTQQSLFHHYVQVIIEVRTGNYKIGNLVDEGYATYFFQMVVAFQPVDHCQGVHFDAVIE
ncbi:hypothetical protein DSECCO2_587520 [anaerobic digester metagenome]